MDTENSIECEGAVVFMPNGEQKRLGGKLILHGSGAVPILSHVGALYEELYINLPMIVTVKPEEK